MNEKAAEGDESRSRLISLEEIETAVLAHGAGNMNSVPAVLAAYGSLAGNNSITLIVPDGYRGGPRGYSILFALADRVVARSGRVLKEKDGVAQAQAGDDGAQADLPGVALDDEDGPGVPWDD
jgi:hypothetical protein